MGGILGVGNPAYFSPLVLTSRRTDTVPRLMPMSHRTPEDRGKDSARQEVPSQEECSYSVTSGDCGVPLFVWQTPSPLSRELRWHPWEAPLLPVGVYFALCSRHSVQK